MTQPENAGKSHAVPLKKKFIQIPFAVHSADIVQKHFIES
jgi:hypothetical protein